MLSKNPDVEEFSGKKQHHQIFICSQQIFILSIKSILLFSLSSNVLQLSLFQNGFLKALTCCNLLTTNSTEEISFGGCSRSGRSLLHPSNNLLHPSGRRRGRMAWERGERRRGQVVWTWMVRRRTVIRQTFYSTCSALKTKEKMETPRRNPLSSLTSCIR